MPTLPALIVQYAFKVVMDEFDKTVSLVSLGDEGKMQKSRAIHCACMRGKMSPSAKVTRVKTRVGSNPYRA
jgi:hypothetical protein